MCKSIVNATRNQIPRGQFLKQITSTTCNDTNVRSSGNGSGNGNGNGGDKAAMINITTHWIDIGDEHAIGETAQLLMKVNVNRLSFVPRNGHHPLQLTPNGSVVPLEKMNGPIPDAGGNPTQAKIIANVNVTPATNANVSTDLYQHRELTKLLLLLSQEPLLYPHNNNNNNNHHHHHVEYAYSPPSSRQWDYPGVYPTQPIPLTVYVNANLHTNPTLTSAPRPGTLPAYSPTQTILCHHNPTPHLPTGIIHAYLTNPGSSPDTCRLAPNKNHNHNPSTPNPGTDPLLHMLNQPTHS
mmetsp:Transcript_8213/g.9645  ORF Transcript_8213/g.9645 Transcript_8213/m.9645 type:complete len:296 (-) Transcript_8213:406-1293(-)